MVRLETLVGQLVGRMDNDHKAALETRKEDRASLRELAEKMEKSGEKMEKSVSGLADEIKNLAKSTASNDNAVLINQSKAAGAFDAGRWIVATLLGVGTLITGALGLYVAYQAGQRGTHYNPEPPVPQYSEKAR
jgi:hypothetical protein